MCYYKLGFTFSLVMSMRRVCWCRLCLLTGSSGEVPHARTENNCHECEKRPEQDQPGKLIPCHSFCPFCPFPPLLPLHHFIKLISPTSTVLRLRSIEII